MKTLVVVGVGALGSHAVMFLRNAEVDIRVIDFDRVEQRNVMSQFYGKPSVGKGKAQSLQQSMNFLYGRKIDAVPHKLVENNAKELLGSADLVLDCLDNGDGRRVIQSYVRANGIPCLHGALAADGSFGSVLWDEHFVIDDVSGTGKTCEDGEHLPFIVTVSSYLAGCAQEFLKKGRKVGFQIHPGGTLKI
jgi:molybdopterin/thiamine biosynthesis adenylyltransferase